MNRIKFIKKDIDGFYEYHLKSELNNLFKYSIFPLSSKLEESILEEWSAFLWKKGITSFGSEENSILYSSLLNFFREDYTVQLIYDGGKNDFSYINKVPEKCKWRYSLEYTTDETDLCKDFSFVTPSEFLKIVNYSNQKTDDYFRISTFEKKDTSHFIKMYHCDVSNWSFVYSKEEQAIKQLLSNEEKRPNKKDFFALADLLINIQIGEDEGYLDYVLIISKQNLDSKIENLEKQLNLFLKNYEALLKNLNEIDSEEKIKIFKNKFDEINK